jgi:hypothetical protein
MFGDKYFQEVEDKLVEETNYKLEISQSKEIAKACVHIPNLLFPRVIIRRSFRFGKSVKNNSNIEKTNCKYCLVKTRP